MLSNKALQTKGNVLLLLLLLCNIECLHKIFSPCLNIILQLEINLDKYRFPNYIFPHNSGSATFLSFFFFLGVVLNAGTTTTTTKIITKCAYKYFFENI